MDQFPSSHRTLAGSIIKRAFILFFLLFVTQSFSQTYDAEVTNMEDSYIIKNSVLYDTHFMSIRINNQKGDKYTTIRIPYSEDSPVEDLEAWIEDVNGKKVRKLKDKEIADYSDIMRNNLYNDAHIKSFELKNNIYPYTIKFSYRCKEKDFFSICHWSPLYDSKIPTVAAKLSLTIPIGYKIAFYQNKIGNCVKDSTKKEVTFTWQANYMHPISPEGFAPSILELTPCVYIVPIEFNYGITASQKDWVSLGNWCFNLNKGLDDLPESEIQKVHELINGISDKKLIVKKLYQYLQDNTRYESVQIGIGGYRAFSASFTAAKKYGDCKALANYMKALLKVAGIPSHWVLIYGDNSENRRDIVKDFVSSQFNHVILLVPLEKDSIWLDCTSKTNPCGYLGTFTQNRYGLVVDENNSRLVKTPALVPSNCYTMCKNTMNIDTSGNVLLTSLTACTGYSFDYSAAYLTQLNREKQAEYLGAIIPYKDFEIKQSKIEKPSRDSASMQLDYTILLKSNATQSGRYLFLQLCIPKLPKLENPDRRHFTLRLTYPVYYMDTTIVNVPDKYKPAKPSDENTENQYGAVKINYVINDNKLEIYRTILINSGEYSVENYKGFYQFMAKLNKAISTPISFTKYE